MRPNDVLKELGGGCLLDGGTHWLLVDWKPKWQSHSGRNLHFTWIYCGVPITLSSPSALAPSEQSRWKINSPSTLRSNSSRDRIRRRPLLWQYHRGGMSSSEITSLNLFPIEVLPILLGIVYILFRLVRTVEMNWRINQEGAQGRRNWTRAEEQLYIASITNGTPVIGPSFYYKECLVVQQQEGFVEMGLRFTVWFRVSAGE